MPGVTGCGYCSKVLAWDDMLGLALETIIGLDATIYYDKDKV